MEKSLSGRPESFSPSGYAEDGGVYEWEACFNAAPSLSPPRCDEVTSGRTRGVAMGMRWVGVGGGEGA